MEIIRTNGNCHLEHLGFQIQWATKNFETRLFARKLAWKNLERSNIVNDQAINALLPPYSLELGKGEEWNGDIDKGGPCRPSATDSFSATEVFLSTQLSLSPALPAR